MSLEEKQQLLVEQLIPLSMEPKFHEVCDRLLADESMSSRFLIKMELGRLTADCIRVIDLRSRNDLHCAEFITGQQRHYIDDLTKNTFKQALAKYQGRYTTGVYEQVIESIKARRQQKGQTQTPSNLASTQLTSGVNLGRYTQRTEERMNYSVKITVAQPNLGPYDAVTLDISVSGARIKVPMDCKLDLNQALHIHFTELEKEYCFDELSRPIAYDIVSQSIVNTHQVLGLRRLEGSQAFSKMLSNLITGYKFRYKVNINDLYRNIPGLNIELHYLAHMSHMPLFISEASSQFHISHKLLTQKNRDTLNYFLDENNVSQLSAMLTPARLKRLLAGQSEQTEELFYCFTFNAKGKLYFYSASLTELSEQKLMPLFFNFGASKASWRVFQVTVQALSHKQGYRNKLLPGDNSDYSALTRSQIQRFSHQLLLTDITNPNQISNYQSWQHKENPNQLKCFAQEKLKRDVIKAVSLHEVDKRQETRFALKTLVNITQGKIKARGITLDISSMGLQVNLDDPVEFDTSTPIAISLPKLQHLSKTNNLQQLAYKIVRIRSGNTLLHLSAILEPPPHPGVEFLKRLIESNRTKLKALSEANLEFKEIAEGLKNLALRQLSALPFAVTKTDKLIHISELAINQVNSNLAHCFSAHQVNAELASDEEFFDLNTLLTPEQFEKVILEPISSHRPNESMHYFELFLRYTSSISSPFSISESILVDELTTTQAQINFIHQAKLKGQFKAIRIGIAPCNTTSLKHVTQELNYLSIHAPNKAKKLEEKLWNIQGIGELIDITHVVQQRYGPLNQK